MGAVAHQGQEHGGRDISPQSGVFGIAGNADDEIAGLRTRCRLILLRIAHMPAHGILVGEVLPGKRLIDENRHRKPAAAQFLASRHCAGLPDAAAFAAAVTTAFVASAEAKSAGVNTRPASTGMRIVWKKSSPTRSVAVFAFDLGGAPSRCTSLADQLRLKSACLGITR